MWIEKRGQQHRVCWRNRSETGPKKAFEPFDTREQAHAFITLARASNLAGAVDYVRNPSNEALMTLPGRPPVPAAEVPSTAREAVAGLVASTSGIGDRYDPRVDVTFFGSGPVVLVQRRAELRREGPEAGDPARPRHPEVDPAARSGAGPAEVPVRPPRG
ncbi:MAG: hypothetical protein ABWX84_08785 [Nocardioides sp.]